MNRRIFQIQGLDTNGQAIGGVATLELDAAFRDVIVSTPDGAFGAEDVDVAGLRVGASLNCTDVTKMNALLDAAVGATTFWGRESGAATWHKYTIDSNGKILWHGADLSLAKNQDGTLRFTGTARFADSNKALADLIELTAGDAGAGKPQTYPVRLYRPHTASFDPDGAGAAITPLHVESIQLSLSAPVEEDYSDIDIGHTAVDLQPWNPLQVTMTHRDASDPGVGAGQSGDISAEQLQAMRGVLIVNLLGRGGAAAKVLTVKNLLWQSVRQAHGPGYTDYTMTGSAGWRSPSGTQFKLTGADSLFEIV